MSNAMKRHIKGFEKQMDSAMRDIASRLRGRVSEQAMWRAVNTLGDEALELTPRDTGALQESQFRDVIVNKGEIVGIVGYDTSKAPYALFVHQIPADHSKENYPNNPPRAQWQFLTQALVNKRAEIIQIINRSRGTKNPLLGGTIQEL